MAKKKKDQSLEDVEKDVMGDFPDSDKEGQEEGQSDKKAKVKQGELDGMPEKTPMGKQADKVIEVWEDFKLVQKALIEEKNKLLPLMKEEKTLVLNLKDSDDNSLEIKVTNTSEKVSINKKKEINL